MYVCMYPNMYVCMYESQHVCIHVICNSCVIHALRGVKIQQYRVFGTVGATLYSSTSLEDVPAADTFSVDDFLVVKSQTDNSISIEMTMEVKFLKYSMVKYLIESNSNSEMTKWLQALFLKMKMLCAAKNRLMMILSI